jgi:UDP-N-acetylglucosamine:LPS N-acetylglucosamine transferase
VLAISSGGGHWVQLLRLRPAFEGCDVTFATVQQGYQSQVAGAAFRTVPDSNRWAKLSALRSAFRIFLLLLELRPDVVVTTGAAPGCFAVYFAKWLGIRSIWIDSIANAEELSLSGQMVKGKADLWLTQWPHLAQDDGPHYRGSVL